MRTDTHDETNCRFTQVYKSAYKGSAVISWKVTKIVSLQE